MPGILRMMRQKNVFEISHQFNDPDHHGKEFQASQ
jgi:hypothetical protein